MREVDPFGYWESHSSAIAGLGGIERSPDPRYLFHTQYHAIRAGRARFTTRLSGVRASFGELSVRVHAWKPEGTSDVILVAGGRLLLSSEAGEEITLPVHFAAQKDVLYALYGYLSEDSDVVARALHVSIDEPEDTSELLPEPPRSVLAMPRRGNEARAAAALLHYGRPDTESPVSQSCTVDQVAALGLPMTGLFGRERAEDSDTAIAQWSEALSITALTSYGATDAGLEGLVVGVFAADPIKQLARSTSLTHVAAGPPPSRASSDFYDFMLMPDGPAAGPDAASDVRERWATVDDWLARLKIGGLAMLGLRYRPESDLISSSAAADTPCLSRNEIGQWSLRLIGRGYSVAPLAFAPVADLVVDSRGLARFLLIVQRL